MTWTPEQEAQRRQWGVLDGLSLGTVDPMDAYARRKDEVALGNGAAQEGAQDDLTELDRSIPLSEISTDPPAPMLIERLDPLGHTILYGTGGIGKGALACHWITQLIHEGHRVLILDWERHPEEWSRRIAALDRGVHTSDLVRHLVPTGPIGRVADEVAWTCDRHELDVVVVDSAVMACGTDPLKPEAAADYAAAILAIGRPTLSLAHVTKLDDARYPFGSVFWHNLARMTWSLSGDNDGEVLLRHRKHNNYQGLGTFALTVTWSDDGQLREVWEKGYNASILDRVLEVLADDTATIGEVLTAINDDEHKAVTRDSLARTLRRAIPGRVRLNDGRYSRA